MVIAGDLSNGRFDHNDLCMCSGGAAERFGGLAEQDFAGFLSVLAAAAQILADIDTLLHRRPRLDGVPPTGDVGEFVQRLAERLRNQYPGPANHVDNGIVAQNVAPPLQPPFQHPEATIVFTRVALMRVAVIGFAVDAFGIIDEVAELAGPRPEIADLPEQPFQALFPATCRGWDKPPGFFGEMDQDRSRLKDRHGTVRRVLIDDRRHAGVGTYLEEVR